MMRLTRCSAVTAALALGVLPLAALGAAPALAAPPAPEAPAIDNRVTGLNAETYAAIDAIKRRNPGSLTEKEAQELAAAIRKDGKVDPVETDLLVEMTNSGFRNIRIFRAGLPPDSPAQVTTFPAVGNAKTVLLFVLDPSLDLAAVWTRPDHGWRTIVNDYKSSPEREAKVLAFVAAELAKTWAVSNTGNSYKPLREEIGRLYGLSNSTGTDTPAGRQLLYRAIEKVDNDARGQVPDFLYAFLKPAPAK